MKKCMFIYGKDGTLLRFPKEEQEKLVKNVIEPMASDGLRTICLAYKDYVRRKAAAPNEIQMEAEPDWEDEDAIITRLTCLAIVGIEDPVRPEVSLKRAFICQCLTIDCIDRFPTRSAN